MTTIPSPNVFSALASRRVAGEGIEPPTRIQGYAAAKPLLPRGTELQQLRSLPYRSIPLNSNRQPASLRASSPVQLPDA